MYLSGVGGSTSVAESCRHSKADSQKGSELFTAVSIASLKGPESFNHQCLNMPSVPF